MTDGWIPFSCFIFRMLPHCYSLMGPLNTVESSLKLLVTLVLFLRWQVKISAVEKPHGWLKKLSQFSSFLLLAIITVDYCSLFSIKPCTVFLLMSLHEGGVSEQRHSWGKALGEPSNQGGCDRKSAHLTPPTASGQEEGQWGQRGCSVSEVRGECGIKGTLSHFSIAFP